VHALQTPHYVRYTAVLGHSACCACKMGSDALPPAVKGGGGGGAKMSRGEVGEPDVARIISAWTGAHA
jgi:hypothetical protein